jgi:hypothetical protein
MELPAEREAVKEVYLAMVLQVAILPERVAAEEEVRGIMAAVLRQMADEEGVESLPGAPVAVLVVLRGEVRVLPAAAAAWILVAEAAEAAEAAEFHLPELPDHMERAAAVEADQTAVLPAEQVVQVRKALECFLIVRPRPKRLPR